MKNKWKEYVDFMGRNSLWISLSILNYSTALSSVFFGLFFIYTWFFDGKSKISNAEDALNKKRGNAWILAMILASFGVIGIVSVLQGNSILSLIAYFQVKLPLLLVLLFLVYRKGVLRISESSWFVYLLPVFWIISASCIHYFQHLQFYNQMVLESKPIPMFTKIYHIEFGAITALVLLIFIEQWSTNKSSIAYRKLALAVAIITAIGLHVLALRTGLVMLYMGFLFWSWRYYQKVRGSKRMLPWLWVLGIAAVLGLVLALPSVKHRIINTAEDIRITFAGGDTNHRSLGQRVEAWRAAVSCLKTNTWGSGVEGEFSAMMKGYEDSKTTLLLPHRIGIHNQFLQMAVQGGWLSAMLLLLSLLIACYRFESGSWILVLMSGLMVESFLERQSGILISVVILLAAWNNWTTTSEKDQEIE